MRQVSSSGIARHFALGAGLLLMLLALIAVPLASQAQAAKKPPRVTIRTTEYGIPRILADKPYGLGYGYGWSLAKENICSMAQIYTTVFTDAGNTWGTFDRFDPFKLYRSAGFGLRLFLPMFGPMGLDYGWRLDDVPTSPNMARGQFHFTIGIDLGEL